MQLLGEELPVSSKRLISAQQEQAGLLWNAGVAGWAAWGRGVALVEVLIRALGMLTVDTGCAQT